jgi:hypothetical protein
MGGSQSKSSITANTVAAINASQTSIGKCITAASQDQIIQLQAVGDITVGDITQMQATSVKAECLFSSTVQSEIQSAVANSLSQAAQASGTGITSALGASSASTYAAINTMLSANIKQEQIQEAVTSTMQRQTVSIKAGGNIVAGNISQTQTAELIAKAIMNTEGYSKVIQNVSNQIDQKTSAETRNPISDILSSVGDLWGKPILYIVIAVILVSVMGAIAAIFARNKQSQPQSQLQSQLQQTQQSQQSQLVK